MGASPPREPWNSNGTRRLRLSDITAVRRRHEALAQILAFGA